MSDYLCSVCGWVGDFLDVIKLQAGDECIYYCPECNGAECVDEVRCARVACPTCGGLGTIPEQKDDDDA